MAKSDEKIYGIYSGSLQWPEMIDKLKSQRETILEVNSKYAESLKKMKIGG